MAVDDVSAPPGIQVVQPAATVEAQPPATNPALQLADALRESSPEIDSGLNNIAGHLQRVQSNKAQADAMRASGKAFGDAVRDGDISPTQNPWYIKAYREASSAIFTRQQASGIIADSNNWPERNDPTAYQARLTQELGGIATSHGMQDVDSKLGFNEAIQPLIAEASSRNQEYNSQRIQQENVQNTSQMASQSVQDLLKAQPNADADTVFSAMEPQHKIWIATGGSETNWNRLAYQAVINAGANMDRLDIPLMTRQPYLGGAPLADRADENGKPFGITLDQDVRTISWAQDAQMNAAYKTHQLTVSANGAKADEWAVSHYGDAWGLGKITADQFTADALAQGFDGEAVTSALGQRGEALRQAGGYGGAQESLWSSDPANQKTIINLTRMASSTGATPEFYAMAESLVGKVPWPNLQAMEERANQTTRANIEIAHSDANAARSDRTAMLSVQLQQHALAADQGKQGAAEIMEGLRQQGYDTGHLSTRDLEDFNRTTSTAALSKTDPTAAYVASKEAAAAWALAYRKKHPLPGSPEMGYQVGSQILSNPSRP